MTDDSKKDKANPPQSPQGDASAVTPAIAIPEPLKVHSLIEYLDVVQQLIDKWNRPVWYRGVSDASRHLVPSIFRLLGDNPASASDEKVKQCRQEEYQANLSFVRQARAIDKDFPRNNQRVDQMFNKNPPSPSDELVDQLIVMRHHGLHSRLLDWTISPTVALLFAVVKGAIKGGQKDSSVWVLGPEVLTSLNYPQADGLFTWGASPIQNIANCAFHPDFQPDFDGSPLPFIPRYSMARHIAQKANFTIHGSHFPLDVLSESGNFLRKIDIPKDFQHNMYTTLGNAGTTWDSLFPDLDGLAKNINIQTERDLKRQEYLAQKKQPPLPGGG